MKFIRLTNEQEFLVNDHLPIERVKHGKTKKEMLCKKIAPNQFCMAYTTLERWIQSVELITFRDVSINDVII